jgi:hypothetical protein
LIIIAPAFGLTFFYFPFPRGKDPIGQGWDLYPTLDVPLPEASKAHGQYDKGFSKCIAKKLFSQALIN